MLRGERGGEPDDKRTEHVDEQRVYREAGGVAVRDFPARYLSTEPVKPPRPITMQSSIAYLLCRAGTFRGELRQFRCSLSLARPTALRKKS